MKRSLRTLTGIVALLAASSASAKDLPNYNAYYDAKAAKPVLTPSAKKLASSFATTMDAQRGVPTFVWSASPPSVFQAPQIALATHEGAARAHLLRSAPMYGVSAASLSTAVVTHVHDIGRGGIIVTFRQVVDGVELYLNDFKVLMRRNHELVAISGSPNPAAVPGMAKHGVNKFKLSAEKALVTALNDLYGTKLAPASVLDIKADKPGYRYFDLLPTTEIKAARLHLSEPGKVKKVYFPLPDKLVPAYYVEMLVSNAKTTDADAYSYVIAADDGRLLYRNNLKHYAAFNYKVWSDPAATGGRPLDGPIADFTPHPTGTPDGTYPMFIAPAMISFDGFNKNPMNTFDPWLAANATQTQGNNVDAYTDIIAPDGFTQGQDYRANVTSPGTFDYTYDVTKDPVPGGVSDQAQGKAALTQIFFTTNWLHDWWYDSGFNEAAGNAQQDNFGRGGVGGDPLHAEGEDSANTQSNNANMSAMSDGTSPRMQMYLWSGKTLASLTVNPGNKTYAVGTAAFGPQTFNKTATLVLGVDGMGMDTNDGCEPFTNNIAGQIVLVHRGTCQFEQKAQNAQQHGAAGIIISNNVAGGPMGMAAGNPPLNTNIATLSVSQADGAALEAAMMNGVQTATMTNAVSVRADGTIDNGVVAHEWGHYIHLRQVSGNNQQLGAMSEGWGDYNASQMVVRPGDNLDGTFALAIYATIADDNSGYFGIRRFPYSTDMNKNPLTFKHIGDSQALPMNAPQNPAIGGGANSEVHNAGEIWNAMLWEGHIAVLKNSQGANPPYTFAEARRRMSDYIEGGFQMAPTDPTYTEQRDAILATAAAADINDMLILAGGFAKRGAGTCAQSPPKASTTLDGVVEDFGLKPEVTIVSLTLDDSVLSCDNDGILDGGEKGKATVTIKNTGTGPLTKTTATITSNTPGVTIANGGMASFGTIAPFATGTASVEVDLDMSVMGQQAIDLAVTVNDPDACTMAKTDSATLQGNYDVHQNASASDDVETDSPLVWTAKASQGPADIWTRQIQMAPNHVWNGIDYMTISDATLESPPLNVANAGNFVMTFKSRYQFEQDATANWDGGLIEVSVDNGATWNDVSMYGNAGYGGVIGDMPNMANNPLNGRQGYVGQNTGWPNMDTVTIDMGAALAGKTVKVRFRVGSDEAQDAYGWDVDDISFMGITNTPFPTTGPNMMPCGVSTSTTATSSASGAGGAGGATASSSSAASGAGGASTNPTTSSSSASSSGSGQGGAGGGGGGTEVGGCGCTTVGSTPATTLSPLVAFALLALRRRRRAADRARS